jgi:hypothetical protein
VAATRGRGRSSHRSEVVVALCAEDAEDVNGRVVHTAGGHVREYVLHRSPGTDLARRLQERITPPSQPLG